jgi:hypothetical protein
MLVPLLRQGQLLYNRFKVSKVRKDPQRVGPENKVKPPAPAQSAYCRRSRYSFNHWHSLIRVLDDGRIELPIVMPPSTARHHTCYLVSTRWSAVVDHRRDAAEQVTRRRYLPHPEDVVANVADDLRADLNHPLRRVVSDQLSTSAAASGAQVIGDGRRPIRWTADDANPVRLQLPASTNWLRYLDIEIKPYTLSPLAAGGVA